MLYLRIMTIRISFVNFGTYLLTLAVADLIILDSAKICLSDRKSAIQFIHMGYWWAP